MALDLLSEHPALSCPSLCGPMYMIKSQGWLHRSGGDGDVMALLAAWGVFQWGRGITNFGFWWEEGGERLRGKALR